MSIRHPSLRSFSAAPLVWVLLMSVGLLVGAVGTASAQTEQAPWPSFAAGPDNASRSPYGLASGTNSAQIGPVLGPPAIAADGTAYVKYDASGTVSLYRINPNGGAGTARVATFGGRLSENTEEESTATAIGPVIGDQGRVFVVAPGGNESRSLFRVDTRDGNAVTEIFQPGETEFSDTPAIDPETQNLYVPLTDGRILEMTPTGSIVNEYRADGSPTAPLVTSDGRVFYSTRNGTVELISGGTRTVLFNVAEENGGTAQPLSKVAFFEDLLYVSSRAPNNEVQRSLYNLDATNGSVRWAYDYTLSSTARPSPPAVDGKGIAYVTLRDAQSTPQGQIQAFTPEIPSVEKTPLWAYLIEGLPSMPAVSVTGQILTTVDGGTSNVLRAYLPSGDGPSWETQLPGEFPPRPFPPAVLSDGAAVVATTGSADIVLGALPEIAPSPISIGNVDAGATASVNVDLANKGTTEFTFQSASVSGSNGEFSLSGLPTAGSTLFGSDVATFTLNYNPAPDAANPSESRSGTLTINTSAGPVRADISAIVNSPQLTATPNPIDFGSVDAQSATSLDVTLQNTGTSNLTITSRGITGTDASLFALSTSTDGTLAPGESFTYTVEYAPNSNEGSHSASLDIGTSLLGTISIPLSGVSQLQELTSTPGILFDTAQVDVDGGTTQETVTLEAPADTDVDIVRMEVVPDPNTADYSAEYTFPSGNYTGQIGANTTQDVAVQFDPAGGGTRAAILEVETGSRGTLQIPLQGFGLTYVLTATPTSVDFGRHPVGETDTVESITVENTGTGTVTSIGADVGTSSDFAVATAPATSLAPGETTTLDASFTPQATGSRTGTLSVTSAEATTQTVSLTGTGDNREVNAVTTDFGFGQVPVGETAQKTITLENIGTVDLTNLTFAFGSTSEFSVVSSSTTSLLVGETVDVTVAYTPTSEGADTATLSLSANDDLFSILLGAYSNTFSLSGEGVAYALSGTPTSVDFGLIEVGTTVSQNVTIENTGSGTLDLSGVSTTGTNAGLFTATTGISGSMLEPGQTLSVTVEYMPDARASHTADLVAEAVNGTTATVALSGTGGIRDLSVSPASASFGTVETGTQSAATSFTVTNTGDFTLSSLAASLSNTTDFAITGDTGETSLEAGASRTIDVAFAPSTSGALTASLNVGDGTTAASAALDGFGANYTLASSTGTLDFGGVKVGTSSATQDIVFTNTGNADLTGLNVALGSTTDYTITGDTGETTLAPGATRTVSVAFDPSVSGTLATSLDATTTEGAAASVSLTGSGEVGALSASTGSATFAATEVGTAGGEQTITFTNTGTASVTGVSVALSNTTDYTITSDTGETTLAAGASRSVTVQFAPSAEGTRSATLSATSTEGASASTSLSGDGLTFALTPSSTTLDFGGVSVGSTAQQTVTIQNTGSGSVDLTNVSLSGANTGQFSIASGSTLSSLAPGATQDVSIEYAPTDAAAHTAALDVSGTDGTGFSVSLSGSGKEGDLTISTTTVSFGTVPVDGTSSTQDVVFTNSGNDTLTGLNIVFGSTTNFTIASDTGESSLAPGASRTVSIQFTPTTGGTLSTTLTGSDDSGESLSASLNGFGAVSTLATSPTSLDFGGVALGSTASQTITLENTGNTSLDSFTFSLDGTNADQFAITGGTGVTSLAPGATQTITVDYTPTATTSHSATLTVTGSNGTSASTTLSGSGLDGDLSASPTSLSFNDQEVGTTSAGQDIVITNTGSADVTGISVDLGGTTDFRILSDTENTVLAPNESRTVTVVFEPGTAGSASAQLTATADDGTSVSVGLSGFGATYTLETTPTTFDFGDVPVGEMASTTVTVQNTGNRDVTLSSIGLSGTDAAAFTITAGNTLSTLTPGTTQDVTIEYTPDAETADAATLEITGDNNTSASTALSGTGVQAALTASAATLEFGSVPVDSTGDAQTVTFTNDGSTDVTGLNVLLSNETEFTITTDTGETTLPPGESRSVTVVATPSARGSASATLDAQADNASVSVDVSVFGTEKTLAPATDALAFGTVEVGAITRDSVTVTNTGNVAVTIASIDIQGTGAAAFSIVRGGSAGIVDIGASRTVVLDYAPSTVQVDDASLVISSDAPTVTVGLSGEGITNAAATFASAVGFGSIATQTTTEATARLQSTGTAPLVVESVSVSGDTPDAFATQLSASLPVNVAPGDALPIPVRFTPTASGAAQATLTVQTNVGPVQTALSGTAVDVSVTTSTVQRGAPVSLTVTAANFFDGSGSSTLYVRRGGDTAYVPVPLSETSATEATASIPDTLVTLRGLDYYVVLDNDRERLSVPKAPSEVAASDPSHLQVQYDTVTAPGSFAPDTYRMVSIPVQPDAPAVRGQLTTTYGSYDPTRWRLLRWNHDAEQYRDVSSDTPLQRGQAAWLITRDGGAFTLDAGTSVVPDSTTLTLTPGWNQIATPFAFPVAWADVQGQAGVEAPVGFADGQFAFNQTVLQPWTGYFVYNPADAPVDLVIPPVAADAQQDPETRLASTSKSSADDSSMPGPYALKLSAHIDALGLSDPRTILGLRPDASPGRDAIDYADPPSVGPHVQLSVMENGEALAGSFRPTGTSGQAWDVQVQASVEETFRTDKTVRIHMQTLHGGLPDGQQRYVLDLDRQRYVPVENGSFETTLTARQPTRAFRVIVGTEAFAKQSASGIPLREYDNSLTSNAPNPFSERTTFAYTLKEQADVTIEIYNVLGQRVAQIEEGTKSAGRHEVTWDARTRYGNQVASGVYFYRIQAGDFTASRKMTLVR